MRPRIVSCGLRSAYAPQTAAGKGKHWEQSPMPRPVLGVCGGGQAVSSFSTLFQNFKSTAGSPSSGMDSSWEISKTLSPIAMGLRSITL